jgi:hypothetical protein
MAELSFHVVVVDGRAWCRLREVALRISGIDLMKAANVGGLEDALVRRVLLGRAIERTASEKER